MEFSKTYTYDKANNRNLMDIKGKEEYTTKYEYNSNNHLKKETKTKGLSIETSEYTYDNNGNQISKSTFSLSSAPSNAQLGIYILGEKRTTARENYTIEINEYDVYNRLINVKNDEGTAIYTYKADGMRLSKDVNGKKTTHVWDGSNIVLDYGATNDRYIRGINLMKSDSNGFYLYNAHGDVVQLANSSGAVTKVYQYDAFGVEKDKDASDNNPFRYCGEYFDKETGTIYLRARHYNPSTGRFISQDSVAGKAKDPLSLNLFTYGHNNPVRFIDPSGHTAKEKRQAYDRTLVNMRGSGLRSGDVGVVKSFSGDMGNIGAYSKKGAGDMVFKGESWLALAEGSHPYIYSTKDPTGSPWRKEFDSSADLTFGTGHSIRTAAEFQKLQSFINQHTSAEIEAKVKSVLLADLDKAITSVNSFIKNKNIILKQHQFDAIISLVFNQPVAISSSSDLGIELIRSGTSGNFNHQSIIDGFTYTQFQGSRIDGLVTRRNNELNLFFNSDYVNYYDTKQKVTNAGIVYIPY